ncbi:MULTISPECIES: MmcB family DNA repair protein [unclassified Beijerinckia]|uniref:MmcB family DNA repair protein n=1 Tax=unclassified Beijerinckia TaxID=2638183 RepID=UPI0008974B0B|nr:MULTISPECIES: MmcB family DNA repair protein [unclassified Beijerinckia]MDH7797952.1 hypothetical protein [Beijerinckia sp. GAS462]SED03943.1 hypothetical protein SAMN05443249_4243 [Beijerinckia sp. 28-YEA-48]
MNPDSPVPPEDKRQSAHAAMVMRGVQRLMRAHRLESLVEMPLNNGRRADVIALRGDGRFHIVEVKSSIADFRTDKKWHEYRDYCDHFSFATHAEVPLEIFPEECGLIVADKFGAEIIRPPSEHVLNAARRKAMLIAFGLQAASRLHLLYDPTRDPISG